MGGQTQLTPAGPVEYGTTIAAHVAKSRNTLLLENIIGVNVYFYLVILFLVHLCVHSL